jgi:hypothetical protein
MESSAYHTTIAAGLHFQPIRLVEKIVRETRAKQLPALAGSNPVHG